MISGNMRVYDYWLTTINEKYGQQVMPSADTRPDGEVRLSIYPTSTGTQDNILYYNCQYIGLTNDAEIDDRYIIQYGKERLKVSYIQRMGRYKQVYLKRIED